MTWKPDDDGTFVMAKPRLVVRPPIKRAVQQLIKDKVVATESDAVELLLHLCEPFVGVLVAQSGRQLPITLDFRSGAPTKRGASEG
jgi:hypothetical protein